MKKLFPIFLILGFVFSMMTISCTPGTGNNKSSKDDDKPVVLPDTPEQAEWTAVTTPEPGQAQYFNSENTYPKGSAYPKYTDTTKAIDKNVSPGETVAQTIGRRIDDNTMDDDVGEFSVTPQNDGLKIRLTFDPDRAPWNHIQFYACETDEEWESADVRTADLSPVSEQGASQTVYELLFPFTEKERWYKVWFSFEENEGEENQRHVNTHDDPDYEPIIIEAKGGQGEFNVYSATNFAEYYSPKRGLYLEKLIVNLPERILDTDAENRKKEYLKVRAEACDPALDKYRWESGNEKYFVIDDIRDEIWFPSENTQNQDEQAFVNILRGCGNLFFTVEVQVYVNGTEFQQTVYGNWPDWNEDLQEEIPDSNWFVDYEVMPSNAKKLPVIRIDQDDGKGECNKFVTEPVAHQVKDSALTWTPDWEWDNILNTPDPYYVKCSITVEDAAGAKKVDTAAGNVKVRGNWTTSYNKKSLRIKFDKKQSMLGLHENEAYKNWVLLACWKDASLLRDAAALEMYKTMFPEYYSSDTQLVEVYINGVYWGIYLLAEQQEAKTGRIEVTEPEDDYLKANIGYLLEFDSYYYAEAEAEQFELYYEAVKNYKGIKDYNGALITTDLQHGYTIKSDVYDMNQTRFIKDYMQNLWDICYSAAYNKVYKKFNSQYDLVTYTPEGATDDEKCKNCIEEVIDTKSLADMYIFNEIVCDPDIYLTSFFMDLDFAKSNSPKLRFEAPWDFDSTMGNKRHCADAKGMFAGAVSYDVNYNYSGTGNPWMFVFINCKWFQDLVKAEWAAANTTAAEKAAEALITAYAEYEPRFQFNRAKWGDPSWNDELNPESSQAAADSQEAAATYLKNWLKTRFTEVGKVISELKVK